MSSKARTITVEELLREPEMKERAPAAASEASSNLEGRLARVEQAVADIDERLAELPSRGEVEKAITVLREVPSAEQLQGEADEELTSKLDELASRVRDLESRMVETSTAEPQADANLVARVGELKRRIPELAGQMSELTARVEDLEQRLPVVASLEEAKLEPDEEIPAEEAEAGALEKEGISDGIEPEERQRRRWAFHQRYLRRRPGSRKIGVDLGRLKNDLRSYYGSPGWKKVFTGYKQTSRLPSNFVDWVADQVEGEV